MKKTLKLSELIPLLQEQRQIMVTGPQRAGTTISSKILSEELNLPYIDETDFHTHNLEECFSAYKEMPAFIMQAPAMSAYCHLVPGAVVFVKRPVHEIINSQRRIDWSPEEESREKAKYFLSEDRYCIAEIKYRIWYQYQSSVPNRYELDYYSLQYHHAWVPQSQRVNFKPRQTSLDEEIMQSGSTSPS